MSEINGLGICDWNTSPHSENGMLHRCKNWRSAPQATEMQTRILDAAYAQQKRMEVASPQATGEQAVDALAEKIADGIMAKRAAQPAAGTTRCPTCGIGMDTNGDGDCDVCTSPVYRAFSAKHSEGTTPQAERPAERPEIWTEMDADGHCTRCGILWHEEEAEGSMWHKCPPGFWQARAVAPVETPLTELPYSPDDLQLEKAVMLLDDKGYTPSPEALAAARFWMNSELRGDVTYPRPLARIIDSVAEAFRDKSEAGLRAELVVQEDANRKLLHEVMQLSAERVSLKNEIAALRERERWIPVSEKLPEIGTMVLVTDTAGHQDINWRLKGGSWYANCVDERTIFTHWKALSAAPSEQK